MEKEIIALHCLVLGGAGFIGSHIVDALIAFKTESGISGDPVR